MSLRILLSCLTAFSQLVALHYLPYTYYNYGDYIFRYLNFRHGKTNGHDNAIELTFRRNKLERR